MWERPPCFDADGGCKHILLSYPTQLLPLSLLYCTGRVVAHASGSLRLKLSSIAGAVSHRRIDQGDTFSRVCCIEVFNRSG